MALLTESTYNRLAGLGHWMMTLAGHTLRAGPACPRSTASPPSRPEESSTEHYDSNNGRALRISLEGKVVQVVLGDIMAHVDVRIGKKPDRKRHHASECRAAWPKEGRQG